MEGGIQDRIQLCEKYTGHVKDIGGEGYRI